uniref:Taxilin beta b n=1 Tax=Cyprinus carpio TaxID=7962 RepID=A0A8C1GPS8_CYPCA
MESCSQSVNRDTEAEVTHDLTEDLSQQLEDIISTYQVSEQPGEAEDVEEEAVPDKNKDQKMEKKMLKALGKEAMLLMQSLNKLGSPEQKLEALIKKHAELVSTIINNNTLFKNLEKVFKHRDLQQKLLETKLTQANMMLKDAEEKHKLQKEHLLKQTAEAKIQVKILKEQETDMKAQLAVYSEKFDEFQGTVSKSHNVYASFKQDMDKMAKKMKKLEKEATAWKSRFDGCNKAVIDMVADVSCSVHIAYINIVECSEPYQVLQRAF